MMRPVFLKPASFCDNSALPAAMTEIDWIIIALLVLSTIVGIVRGVTREILAIVGWIAGILLALNFAGDVAEKIPLESLGYIPRVMIAAVLMVAAVLFLCGLLGMILRKLLEVAEITFEDRALGAVFGLARGVVVVCACVFLFGLSETIHQSAMWRQSILIGPAETLIDWSEPFLPQWLQDLHGAEEITRVLSLPHF